MERARPKGTDIAIMGGGRAGPSPALSPLQARPELAERVVVLRLAMRRVWAVAMVVACALSPWACSRSPGRVLVTFEWTQPPGPRVYVWATVQAPSSVGWTEIAAAGPEPFEAGRPFSLEVPNLPNGERRRVVALARTTMNGPVDYFGVSREFTLEPGGVQDVAVLVPIHRTVPAPSRATITVDGAELEEGASLGPEALRSTRLRTKAFGAARMKVSNDVTFNNSQEVDLATEIRKGACEASDGWVTCEHDWSLQWLSPASPLIAYVSWVNEYGISLPTVSTPPIFLDDSEPELISIALDSPSVSGYAQVRLTTSEDLDLQQSNVSLEPTCLGRGAPNAVILLETDPERGPQRYVASISFSPSDPEGQYTIYCHLVDLAGNSRKPQGISFDGDIPLTLSRRPRQWPGLNPSASLYEATDELCSNGADDDGDGFADCDDPQCLFSPDVAVCPKPTEAGPTACTDGQDNDRDGTADCLDDSCALDPWNPACDEEHSELDCRNGLDDDADGLPDCLDRSCSWNHFVSACRCDETGFCLDALDNDLDSQIDCDDPDCAGAAACAEESRGR